MKTAIAFWAGGCTALAGLAAANRIEQARQDLRWARRDAKEADEAREYAEANARGAMRVADGLASIVRDVIDSPYSAEKAGHGPGSVVITPTLMSQLRTLSARKAQWDRRTDADIEGLAAWPSA